MAASQRFIAFGLGSFGMYFVLKTFNQMLYKMDEERPEKMRREQLHQAAIAEAKRLLAAQEQ